MSELTEATSSTGSPGSKAEALRSKLTELSKPKAKEVKEPVEIVKENFNKAFSLMEKEDESMLTPEEKADLDLMHEVKSQTLDKGTLGHKLKIPLPMPGRSRSQTEFMPVDGLISFLQRKIDSGSLSD